MKPSNLGKNTTGSSSAKKKKTSDSGAKTRDIDLGSNFGSMNANSMNGSMAGSMNNSMYGMGGPAGMNSNNNMMGSMYGPQPNSMYGMGAMNPDGSMYGMNSMGGAQSMNGMGSMNNMGSMGGSFTTKNENGDTIIWLEPMVIMVNPVGGPLGVVPSDRLDRYNSMGLGSGYGSLYGLGGFQGQEGSMYRPEGLGSIRGSFSRVDSYRSNASANSRRSGFTTGTRASNNDNVSAAGKSAVSGSSATSANSKNTTTPKSDGNSTRSAPVAGAKTPTSIMKNSSASAGEVNGKRVINKALDDNVTGVVVHATKNSKVTIAEKKVKVDGKEFTFTETHAAENGTYDFNKSDVLKHLTEQAHCAHVSSLLSFCGDNNAANVKVTEKVVTDMAVNIIKRLECSAKENKEKFKVFLSGGAFPASNRATPGACQVKDVLAKTTLTNKAQFGTNPIYGSCLLNITEEEIKTSADVAPKISKCVKNFNLKDDESLVLQLNVTQIRSAKEVYITSVLFAFLNHQQKTFEISKFLERAKSKKEDGVLFATALGGASRTAILIPISDADTPDNLKKSLPELEKMLQQKNRQVRSGSVGKFTELTKAALDKNTVKDEKIKERMKKMMQDAETLMKDPEKNRFKAYPSSSK
ncbi:hypothetical protein AGDE_16164 [Angomonas deanei]|nr:hypothetical protein AGDE_16164 [Angomonas deanei]|eukprot:EPY17592.1 hypothetical protein AGDE_16164 [Angomonas deanei]